jgi:nitroreductase
MAAIRQVCPGFINNAPALIAICSDMRLAIEVTGEGSAEYVSELDSGAAAAFLSLAAPALGLGMCLVTSWTKPPVQAVLGLPEHIKPYALVAIGRPVPKPPKAARRFEPIVHQDQYGNQYVPPEAS